jgi:predicted TIM-barrel fold metal-dependent hydrolase
MVIDFEHHFLPEELWLQKGGVKGENRIFYERGLPRGNLIPQLYDIDEHLRVMDAVGIDVAVLSIAVSNDEPVAALEECKIWNDRVAEIVEKHPTRFVGLAPIPPLGGQGAFDELERAIGSLGMKGVVIRSQASGLSLDAQEFYPFYERVSALDVPIFVHPSGVPAGFDILNAPYDLHRQIGREFDLAVATTRMILSGTLEDFPDLKLVFSHKGGGIATLRERILYRYALPGAPGTRMRRPFDDYFNRLYFNLAGHWGGMNSVVCALTTISPSRLIFATDYPQNHYKNPMEIKTYIENIRKLDLSAADLQRVLGDNAKDLLGLSQSVIPKQGKRVAQQADGALLPT